MFKLYASKEWASDAPTPAQIKEFFAQIESGRITKSRFQAFLRGGKTNSIQEPILDDWKNFYKKYFEFQSDFLGIEIPAPPKGFDRIIILAKELCPNPLNRVYDACQRNFPCWRYADDLDSTVTKNDRMPDKASYAVCFRDRIEADEELRNKSANKLKEEGILGITLVERMIYELKYWDETKQHLDIDNWTLCTGSRYSDGDIPYASWSVSKFRVYWHYPGNYYDDLRSRAAVPC